MKDLIEIKEDLQFIIERESERIEPLVAAGKFPVEASVRTVAKEALTLLNNHIERLESQELVEEVKESIINVAPPEARADFKFAGIVAQAAIDIIKGNE